MAKAIGVVDVLIPGQTPEHPLAELGRQRVAAVLPGPDVGENLSGPLGQAKGVIKFTEGKQTSAGGGLRAVKLQPHAALESDLQIG